MSICLSLFSPNVTFLSLEWSGKEENGLQLEVDSAWLGAANWGSLFTSPTSSTLVVNSYLEFLPDRTLSRLIGDLDERLDAAFICSPWSILVHILKAPRKEINCLLFL